MNKPVYGCCPTCNSTVPLGPDGNIGVHEDADKVYCNGSGASPKDRRERIRRCTDAPAGTFVPDFPELGKVPPPIGAIE